MVQAFHLPKYQHVVATYSTDSPKSQVGSDTKGAVSQIGVDNTVKYIVTPINLDAMHGDQEDDPETEEVIAIQPESRANGGLPMTMRELAVVAKERPMTGNATSSVLADGFLYFSAPGR